MPQDGEFVDVVQVLGTYPAGVSTNSADELVSERFSQAKTQADTAFDNANTYLQAIASSFNRLTASMPSVDVTYQKQNISLSSDIDSKRPSPPSEAALTPGTITDPGAIALNTITLANLTVPTENIPAFGTDYAYSNPAYSTTLASALATLIETWVEDGGTGLGATVEAALLARAQARTDTQTEKIYTEAETYFAARGWTMPPGALSGRLAEAVAEKTKADEQVNYEILIEQARLAQNNTQFAITAGNESERDLMAQWNHIADRYNESLKFVFQSAIEKYRAQIEEYNVILKSYEVRGSIDKIKIDAETAINNQKVDEYKARIDKYKADIEKELGLVETIAKNYGYKVAMFEADAKVAAAELGGQVKEFDARITQAVSQTELAIKEADLVLRGYLAAKEISLESEKTAAIIAAQIAASSLSMVNASASLSGSTSHGYSQSLGYSISTSNSASLSESHAYTEL